MRFLPALVLILACAAAPARWTLQLLPFQLTTGETARKMLPATMPGGIAVFDYDNDGRLDLFFPNGGSLPAGPKSPNALFRNLGAGKFENVTTRAALAGRFYDIGAAVGDYDNDGLPDLLVAGLRGVTLYRNTKSARFDDVTARAGIDNRGRWSVGAAWFDLENDGDLDLFVINYVQWDPKTERQCLVNGKPDFCHPQHYRPTSNALFRNNGDGTFTDISESSGIAAHLGKGMGVAAADFDADGLTDLFVTNDRVFNFFFRNRGGGRFSEEAFDKGVAVPQDGKPVSGMGVDAQDWNNDGRPDLIYTALRDETFPIYRAVAGAFQEATQSTRLAVLTRAMAGWGVVLADLDNDGWKDIVAARSDALSISGGNGAASAEPPSWLRNENGRFALGMDWEAFEPAMYRGAVAADLDNDGCLDVVLTALDKPARILWNRCAQAAWLAVKVSGAGALVRLGNQVRHNHTSVGYASSYSGPLHFGLAGQDNVEVEVKWSDGHTRRIATPTRRLIEIAR